MTRPEDHQLLVEINLRAPKRRIDAAKIVLPQLDAVQLFRRLKGDLEHIRHSIKPCRGLNSTHKTGKLSCRECNPSPVKKWSP